MDKNLFQLVGLIGKQTLTKGKVISGNRQTGIDRLKGMVWVCARISCTKDHRNEGKAETNDTWKTRENNGICKDQLSGSGQDRAEDPQVSIIYSWMIMWSKQEASA